MTHNKPLTADDVITDEMLAPYKNRYRIVRDDYSGYEVQRKVLWWWREVDINTHRTIQQAKRFIYDQENKTVWPE